MNYYGRWNPEDKEETSFEIYQKLGWPEKYGVYPEDLPIPRRRTFGSKEPGRFFPPDLPLPGTYQKPLGKTQAVPAWVDFFEEGVVYPGAKLDKNSAKQRAKLATTFEKSNFQDEESGKALLEFDRFLGFSPIFELHYYILNLEPYSEVILFEINGVPHVIHFNHSDGYFLDDAVVSENPEEAKDPFFLLETIIAPEEGDDILYPVISSVRYFHKPPESFWNAVADYDPEIIRRIGKKRP